MTIDDTVAPGRPRRGPALDWREQGEGPPILLVHGALADRRLWDRHLPLLARAGHRAIAVTLPHHGPAPNPANGLPFGSRAHADALGDFVEALGYGPVHLVAWSYAAHAALVLAVERPALLRSVFVYEPGMPTWLEAPADLRAFAEDAQVLFAPVMAALATGDLEAGLQHLIDGSAHQPGHFATQSPETRQIERDNTHTLPMLLQQTPPPALSAAQLAAIRVPVCVGMGERTRPAYGVVSRAAQAAVAGPALTVPGAGHMWPDEDPHGFCDAVRAIVAAH